MEYACGNIFIRTCGEPMKCGDVIAGHKHNFDHATFVATGAIRIERTIAGRTSVVDVVAGELPVLIVAGVEHKLTALADGTTYFCIYSHRLPRGEVVQRYTGWTDAYT